jgi:serine protease
MENNMITTPEEHTARLRRIVRGYAPKDRTEQPGGRPEWTDAPAQRPDDILHHVDLVLKRLPADEVGDPDEFRKAVGMLLQYAEPALKKALGPEPEILLDPDERGSIEALIIPDGSRPSFLLRGGQIAKDHPFLGIWKGDFEGFATDIAKLAACVGRIEPPNGGPALYSGTGTLVDRDKGLVLTNYHVVLHARDTFKVRFEVAGQVWKVLDDWLIDFDGETGSTRRNRWRIKEVRLPQGVGVAFKGIDAAVLRIEQFDPAESVLPNQSIVLSGDADYATGAAVSSLITIGFPGPPDTSSALNGKVDWSWVIGTLFNNRFGLKRVAPGLLRGGVGQSGIANGAHVLTHDATTFGGASGSLIHAWKDADNPAFALHFAGDTLTDNYAIGFNPVNSALHEAGLQFKNSAS